MSSISARGPAPRFLVLLLPWLPAAAVAQTEPAPADGESAPAIGLPEVIVSARNRGENLQDVPLSISVVSGEELERELVFDVSGFSRRAANIIWNPGNPRQSSISIRGVGKQGQTDAQDPSVGIIVDGVSFAYNALSAFNFIDVESVEVTRGPQGTLLGKNTTMGALSINTRKPSFSPDFNFSLSWGTRDSLIANAAGGGPVIDGLLAWRGTFYVDKQQGAFRNAYDNGRRSYTDRNRMSGRLQFLLTPTDTLSVRLTGEITPRSAENTNGLVFYEPLPATYSNGAPVDLNNDASTRLARRWFRQQASYTYEDDYLGTSLLRQTNNDNWQPILTGTTAYTAYVEWEVGTHTLTSISAYRDYYFEARNEEGTPFDIQKNNNTTVDYMQKSQELRITSPVGGFVDYQAGLYFIRVENNYYEKGEYGSDAGAWLATPAQYSLLDADASGRQLLLNSLDRLFRLGWNEIDNRSAAVFAQANWHFTDRLTLTTGVRFTREDRRNTTSRLVTENGFGSELNPVAVNGVNLGGFATNADGTLAAGNSIAQLQLADFTANKYFGVPLGGEPGAAWEALTVQQRSQVAAARSLRQSQIGTLWGVTEGVPFKETQPSYNFTPTIRLTDGVNLYASYQYGEKAGISQFTNGLPNNARPEKSTAYELGIKSRLLNDTLTLNVDVFQNDIRDYQQSVQVLDEYTTRLRNDGQFYFTSATGNVPKVRVRGLEVDAVYAGLPYTSLRFAGAYNDAKYVDFPNAAQPPENGYPGAPPFRSLSGRTLPGAAKFTATLSGEVAYPLFGDKDLRASFTHFYTSSYNENNSLSVTGVVPAYHLTDASVGIARHDGVFDVSLVVRNLLDTEYRSQGWGSWSPNAPRWYAVTVRGRL